MITEAAGEFPAPLNAGESVGFISESEASAPEAAPEQVKAAVAAANAIAMTPYIWGGGHGSFESSGYDCSGAVSYALHGGGLLESPLDSTGLETWGEAGPGKWITVYANAEHAWMIIGGLAFDTVGGPGPRWHPSPVDSPGRFHRPASARPLAVTDRLAEPWNRSLICRRSSWEPCRGSRSRSRSPASATRCCCRSCSAGTSTRTTTTSSPSWSPPTARPRWSSSSSSSTTGSGSGTASSARCGGARRPRDLDARLAWVIIIGTIPAGILGVALEHKLRALFASPTSAAIFLTINGILLLAVERFRRRPPQAGDGEGDGDERIAKMGFRQALGIGAAQALALIPGISRSGVTMGGGLLAGLSNEDAARYAFLLATPVIAAAGLLKLPELFGSAGSGVRGQALVGAIAAAITTWLAVKFLLKYFETSRLTPFGFYCVGAGLFCLVVFSV